MIVQIKAQPRAAYKEVRKCGCNAEMCNQAQITCLPSGALRRTWNEPDDG